MNTRTITKSDFLNISHGPNKFLDWSRNDLLEISKKLSLSLKGNKQYLYNNITNYFRLNPETVISINERQQAGDCPFENQPINNYCPENKPYMGKTKKGFNCCYFKPSPTRIKKLRHVAGEKYDALISRLIKSGYLYPNSTASKEENIKIIIYDTETTSLIYKNNYPYIVQLAMYTPETDEIFNEYIRPPINIDIESSGITKIYNVSKRSTYNPLLYSQPYKITKKKILENESDNYRRLAKFLYEQFSEFYDLDDILINELLKTNTYRLFKEKYTNTNENNFIASTLGSSNFDLLTQALKEIPTDLLTLLNNKMESLLHEQIIDIIENEHNVKTLQDEVPFDYIAEEFYDYVYKDTNENTIILMVAHNGKSFDEPILRKEFERVNKSFYIKDNVLFVDSYLLALAWLPEGYVDSYKLETLHHKFSEVDESIQLHNAINDVLVLWDVIKAIFRKFWGTDNIKFIQYKLLEFTFSSQLMNVKYLGQIAPYFNKSREYEQLGEKEILNEFDRPREK